MLCVRNRLKVTPLSNLLYYFTIFLLSNCFRRLLEYNNTNHLDSFYGFSCIFWSMTVTSPCFPQKKVKWIWKDMHKVTKWQKIFNFGRTIPHYTTPIFHSTQSKNKVWRNCHIYKAVNQRFNMDLQPESDVPARNTHTCCSLKWWAKNFHVSESLFGQLYVPNMDETDSSHTEKLWRYRQVELLLKLLWLRLHIHEKASQIFELKSNFW